MNSSSGSGAIAPDLREFLNPYGYLRNLPAPLQVSGSTPKSPWTLVYDIESCSEVSLRTFGTHDYWQAPSTHVLCTGGALVSPDGQVEALGVVPGSVARTTDHPATRRWLRHIISGGMICAHNVEFEYEAWTKTFPGLTRPPREQWTCTMARSAACGHPMSLEKLCEVARLPVEKDMSGNRLMKSLASPQKPTPRLTEPWRHHTPEKLARLQAYCLQDVIAEAYAHCYFPELSPAERMTWITTLEMNARGIPVDRLLAKRLWRLCEAHAKAWEARIDADPDCPITGADLTRVGYLRQVFQLPGDCLDKDEVQRLLDDPEISPEGSALRTMLEARASISLTAPNKLQSMLRASGGRVRGTQVYHGAGTGRWAGRRLQPHNMVRESFSPEEIEEFSEALKRLELDDYHDETDKVALLEAIYGDARKAASMCLRGTVAAPEGRVFYGGDLSQIEARGGFWFAGETLGLELFQTTDIYVVFASWATKKAVEDITKHERNLLGKPGILSCQYQAAGKRLVAQYGLDPDLADLIVRTYRGRFRKITGLWRLLERMTWAAMENVGQAITSPKGLPRWAYMYDGRVLWLRLPSGRKIAYCYPRVEDITLPWGAVKPAIVYGHVTASREDSPGRWVEEPGYGGKYMNHLVQGSMRDIIAGATQRVVATGELDPIFLVHDEVNSEAAEGCTISVDDYCGLLTAGENWSEGLPIKAEGWRGKRYRK